MSDDVTIKYKGQSIATMDASGTKTLGTQGKYCEGDIAVEYVKPAAPSGTKQISITANGTTTENVAAYANAEITVDVQSGGGEWTTDGIATRTEPFGDLVITASEISNDAFRNKLHITGIRSTTVTAVYGGACMYCKGLLTIFLPKVTTNRNDTFSYCTALKTVVIGSIGGSGNAFSYDSALEIVDLSTGNIETSAFNRCSVLSKLILRSSAIQRLGGINAFNLTPFASGGAGGEIYIHKALYDHLGDGSSLDYKAATNWSTIDGYGTITWAQIEGSIYETQYADGTPIT